MKLGKNLSENMIFETFVRYCRVPVELTFV